MVVDPLVLLVDELLLVTDSVGSAITSPTARPVSTCVVLAPATPVVTATVDFSPPFTTLTVLLVPVPESA